MMQENLLEQTLSTPSFDGTQDERLEALTLWTGILTSIKKVSDLPSKENSVNILSFLISECNQTIQKLTNGSMGLNVIRPTVATVGDTAITVSDNSYNESVESAKRLQYLAGIKK